MVLWVIECTIVNLTVTLRTLLFRWNAVTEHAASSYCHMAVSVIADYTPGLARPCAAHVRGLSGKYLAILNISRTGCMVLM